MIVAKVWQRLAEERIPGEVVEALARAGVSTFTGDPIRSTDPGIIFFDRADEGLDTLVRELSGRRRLLLVELGQGVTTRWKWNLLAAGASDVLHWGDPPASARQVAARLSRWKAVDKLVDSRLVRANLVGRSSAWRAILAELVEVARFSDASVLITGESGTGKELAARLLHTLDPRPDKGELIIVDCASISPTLSGSEFFGHERGAFTGATEAREGAFARADGGTLFLDELGELPLELQAELLRVVQEGSYKPVGGNTWRRTNFRLVCATNRDLREEERSGRFRRDLFHRIARWHCHLPPLRERREDVLPLLRHFLGELRGEDEPPQVDEAVCELLLRRAYPGNIRELRHLAARIWFRHAGAGPISVGDLPPEERPGPSGAIAPWQGEDLRQAIQRAVSMHVGLKEIGRAAEEVAVDLAVDAAGSLAGAARLLGVTPRALQMRRANRQRQAECPQAKAS